jgi:hypothetical protein
LATQREDQLRAQISKVGVWIQADDLRMAPNQPKWQIILFIQNASELPVEVHVAELAIDTVGYKNVPASAGSEPGRARAVERESGQGDRP